MVWLRQDGFNLKLWLNYYYAVINIIDKSREIQITKINVENFVLRVFCINCKD